MNKTKPKHAQKDRDFHQIPGFLKLPKKNATGSVYRGRMTCPDVQWTGMPPDVFATFTITAEELADAAENNLLWTDQDVQRGIKPGLPVSPPKELSLSNGYPNSERYVFDVDKANDIVEKLLCGEKLFLNPLVWNLRPGHFEAYWNRNDRELYIYGGRIYLPDSHHRQQAIIKAVRAWRDAPREYPRFSGAREFKVELYLLSREDEGNYFFDKNQRPKPTAKSKAYDLTTLDDLSLLAKRVIENSNSLQDNVNRVTDRLSPKNPQVITLSTLREMMKAFAATEQLDQSELEGLAIVAARFYDLLSKIRPELGKLSPPERKDVRNRLVVDSAVMMHGYASLMREFNDDVSKMGASGALKEWEKKLSQFRNDTVYTLRSWSGDLFEKRNPLWTKVGVVKPGRDSSSLTVLNTGGARAECSRVLKSLLASPSRNSDLTHLTVR